MASNGSRVGHSDTTAHAQRLGAMLKNAVLPATVFGAKVTSHALLKPNQNVVDDDSSPNRRAFVL